MRAKKVTRTIDSRSKTQADYAVPETESTLGDVRTAQEVSRQTIGHRLDQPGPSVNKKLFELVSFLASGSISFLVALVGASACYLLGATGVLDRYLESVGVSLKVGLPTAAVTAAVFVLVFCTVEIISRLSRSRRSRLISMAKTFQHLTASGALSTRTANELMALLVAHETVSDVAPNLAGENMKFSIKHSIRRAIAGVEMGERPATPERHLESATEVARLLAEAADALKTANLKNDGVSRGIIMIDVSDTLVTLGRYEEAQRLLQNGLQMVRGAAGPKNER